MFEVGHRVAAAGQRATVIGTETNKRGKVTLTVRFDDGREQKSPAAMFTDAAPGAYLMTEAERQAALSRPMLSSAQYVRAKINGSF